jgi:hypothetical protein
MGEIFTPITEEPERGPRATSRRIDIGADGRPVLDPAKQLAEEARKLAQDMKLDHMVGTQQIADQADGQIPDTAAELFPSATPPTDTPKTQGEA